VILVDEHFILQKKHNQQLFNSLKKNIMKKMILMIAIGCFITTHSYAQNEFQFGIKVGTNLSSVFDSEGESFTSDSKFGLAAGTFFSLPIGQFLGVQPEILFSQKGYKAKGSLLGSTYEITHTTNYIDIPILFAIKPVPGLTLLAGPQYSYLISQKNTFENGQTTIAQEEEFNNENLRKNTLCFTGGLDFNMDPAVLSIRTGWDLYKNNGDGTTSTPRYKNVWYQVTLGIRFAN
jgi:hypothetical protein